MFADVEDRMATQVLYGYKSEWKIDVGKKSSERMTEDLPTALSTSESEFDLFDNAVMTGGQYSFISSVRNIAAISYSDGVTPTPEDLKVLEVASERVTLMAAKYADNEKSKEILARLEILDQRLLSIDPPIKPFQIERLESAVKLASELAARRRLRAKRLALNNA